MAAHTIVKWSQLGNRMDSQFHNALSSLRDRVDALKEGMTVEQAMELLARIPAIDKRCLQVLRRGESGLQRSEREYPHLSVALVEANAAEGIQRITARIAEDAGALDALLSLDASDQVPRPGWLYRVKERGRGEPFTHVVIPIDAAHETDAVCAWPVDETGAYGGGSMVKTSSSALDMASGRPSTRTIPDTPAGERI